MLSKNGFSLTSVPGVFTYLLLRAVAILCLPEMLFFSVRSYLVSDVVMGPSVELLKSPCYLEQSVAVVIVLTTVPCLSWQIFS